MCATSVARRDRARLRTQWWCAWMTRRRTTNGRRRTGRASSWSRETSNTVSASTRPRIPPATSGRFPRHSRTWPQKTGAGLRSHRIRSRGESEGVENRDARRDHVIQLDQEDQGNAYPGRKENAGGRCDRIQGLGDQNPGAHQWCDLRNLRLLEQVRPKSVLKSGEQRHAQEHDVEPVLDERQSKSWKASQQRGREWHQGHAEEERELEPRVVAVTSREEIELRALANPEDAEGHETHRVNQHIRAKPQQRLPEISLGGPRIQGWYRKPQDEQGHPDSEDAVRYSSEAVDVRARQLVEAAPARGQIHPVRMTEAIVSAIRVGTRQPRDGCEPGVGMTLVHLERRSLDVIHAPGIAKDRPDLGLGNPARSPNAGLQVAEAHQEVGAVETNHSPEAI